MKKQLFMLSFISLLLVSLAYNVTVLGLTKYRITGYVYQKDGIEASGIKMEILEEGLVLKSVKTDRTGKYRIDVELVENQEYQIRLSKDKYQTRIHDFTTPSSSEADIDLSFTVNKLPIPEANGEYQGFLYEPIVFDSQGSNDPDEDVLDYYWSFGDNEHSSELNPTHIYKTPGEFTVTLEVIDIDGATATDTTKCIIANQPPKIVLNGPYAVKVGEIVNFDTTGSYDPDGEITTYQWLFDDETTSTSQNPSHVYNKKGDYTVTLTVTDDFGLTTTDTVPCVVLENQSPVAVANGPYSGYANTELLFDGSGTYDPDDIQFTVYWEFGDGSSSDKLNPRHTYQEEGAYTVTLTVSDSSGASNTETTSCTVLPPLPMPPIPDANGPYSSEVGRSVYFSSTGSLDPDSENIEYHWDFGDGEYSINPASVHIYTEEGTYIIFLSITDDTGLTGTDTTECIVSPQEIRSFVPSVQPNESPIAEGNGPYTGNKNKLIHFNSMGSYDPDGEITEYLWDFGDGTTSMEPNPDHLYESPGNYDVSLQVSDNQRKTKTYTTLCTIFLPNLSPISQINGSYHAKMGEVINFNSNGSYDPDGTITSYIWEYGDGNTSNKKNPEYTYNNPGYYLASLTVIDEKQSNHTSSIPVTILENQPPIPVLEGPKSIEIGQTITFSGLNSYDPDGEITENLIDFGDGTFSYSSQASHIYNEPRTYTISLTIVDNNQNQQTTSYECLIYENKPPKIVHDGPYYAQENMEINFNSLSYDSDGWISNILWSFGDGFTSNKQHPAHFYNTSGTYLVQITLTDNQGKISTESTSALVVKNEDAKFPVITSMVVLTIFSTYLLERKYQFIGFFS